MSYEEYCDKVTELLKRHFPNFPEEDIEAYIHLEDTQEIIREDYDIFANTSNIGNINYMSTAWSLFMLYERP